MLCLNKSLTAINKLHYTLNYNLNRWNKKNFYKSENCFSTLRNVNIPDLTLIRPRTNNYFKIKNEKFVFSYSHNKPQLDTEKKNIRNTKLNITGWSRTDDLLFFHIKVIFTDRFIISFSSSNLNDKHKRDTKI